MKLTNLTEQTKITLNKISETENYFRQKINQRQSCSKKLSKYLTVFDDIDKVLIDLSTIRGGVSIISLMSVARIPVGITSASLTLSFSLTTVIVKKLLSITRNKKEKPNKILMLAKSKLSSIEILASQALIDMETSHEEFVPIFKEKVKYEKMKENVRNVSEKQENMRLNCVILRK